MSWNATGSESHDRWHCLSRTVMSDWRRGYRLDLLVEGLLVVEVKAVDKLSPLHMAQLLSYLKLGDYRLGLLINFNVLHLRNGIKRVANRL
jgi:GxxExxY protein